MKKVRYWRPFTSESEMSGCGTKRLSRKPFFRSDTTAARTLGGMARSAAARYRSGGKSSSGGVRRCRRCSSAGIADGDSAPICRSAIAAAPRTSGLESRSTRSKTS